MSHFSEMILVIVMCFCNKSLNDKITQPSAK